MRILSDYSFSWLFAGSKTFTMRIAKRRFRVVLEEHDDHYILKGEIVENRRNK